VWSEQFEFEEMEVTGTELVVDRDRYERSNILKQQEESPVRLSREQKRRNHEVVHDR